MKKIKLGKYSIGNMRRFVSSIMIFVGCLWFMGIGVYNIANTEESDAKKIETPKVVYVEKIVEKIVEKEVPPKNDGYAVDIRSILPWYPNLEKTCKKKGVDPRLMVAIYKVESEFNPRNVDSRYKATGLGQILPSTYRDIHRELKDECTWANMKEPWANIRYTTHLMSNNMKRYKSAHHAVWAYGGCVSINAKFSYMRKINTALKEIYNIDITDVEKYQKSLRDVTTDV